MIDEIEKIEYKDRLFYFLAKTAAENCNNRKIVTWIDSIHFRQVLKKYFNKEVTFGLTQRNEAIINGKIYPFEKYLNSYKDYYLVSLDRGYDKQIENQLKSLGLSEINDFVFKNHRPIELNNFTCGAAGYKDSYGNVIIGEVNQPIKKIIFNGCNNKIIFGNKVSGYNNLIFNLSSNTNIEIGANTRFNSINKFEIYGQNGRATISIGNECRFTDALFRIWTDNNNPLIKINDRTTFETNCSFHANSGKKLIIGRDCMFSHNINLWAGDGHTIFDVNTGKNINSDFSNLSNKKNKLVIGDHVWVGLGSFIMHGTDVGCGSIIGACSVVKGQYPNNCSIAGNPAALVKEDCAWTRDGISYDIKSCGNNNIAKTTKCNAALSGSKVLVIGGTGLSGKFLVKRLIELGNDVTIATRGLTADEYGDNVTRLFLDVTDFNSVKDALYDKNFDVVFDNLSHTPLNTYNVLANVNTKKYVQLSSVMAYANFHIDLKEKEINLKEKFQLDDWDLDKQKNMKSTYCYMYGKRYSENLAYQMFSNIDIITVRIPYVLDKCVNYYADCIVNGIPMAIKDLNKEIPIVRADEVGNFLVWIASQKHNGPINFSCKNTVKIGDIIKYIEKKVNGKAIISNDGETEPFNVFGEGSFSLNLDKAIKLGCRLKDIGDWFWKYLDNCINSAVNIKNKTTKPNQEISININSINNAEMFNKTILALDKSKCTACGACMNVCPKNAIEIKADEQGYLMPFIDEEKCVLCGLCKNTCPKLNNVSYNHDQQQCFAYMANDEIRKVSASGGAFTAIANYILDNGGVVFGAGWKDNFELSHQFIESKNDINRIQGSKYLQSYIGLTFRDVKKFLSEGRKVLYVGTPCQIDGLKHYLKNDYDNLYTIDLLCRGVPSTYLFQKYLRENCDIKNLVSVEHKCKEPLGWGAYTRLTYKDGHSEFYNILNDVWMNSYLADVMDRESCYQCPYSGTKRVGDISIGDFWQIAKHDKNLDDRQGTSIVIANTLKGKTICSEIDYKKKQEVPLSFEVQYNSALHAPRKIPSSRKNFLEDVKVMPIGAALDRVLYKDKIDFGIVGWWENLNYGGTLTYFALNKAIESMGYSVLMIRQPSTRATMPNENTVPFRFAKKHYKISRLYAHKDMHLLNYACKGFVSGSDQLWNPYLEQYSGAWAFCSFANQNSIRVSYASSFGNVQELPQEYINKYRSDINKFEDISVREDYAVGICKKSFNKTAQFVCDPVFLIDRNIYYDISKSSTIKLPDKYLMNFILDPNEEKTELIKSVSQKLGYENIIFTDLQNAREKSKIFNSNDVYAEHSIEDWIKAYANSNFVITDSFHGTCFAVIFNKPFISLANAERGSKRFESLLNWLGLKDRLVYSVDQITNKHFEPINYSKVNKTLEKFKVQSYNWLKNALMKKKY